MKKAALVILIILISEFPLFAEKIAVVSLRFSRQDSHVRIVLQSDNDSIDGATVDATSSVIRVIFPSDFQITKPDNFIFQTAKKDRTFTIDLNGVTAVRQTRIMGPARLVFDLIVGGGVIGTGVPQVSPSGPQQASTQSQQGTINGTFRNMFHQTAGKPTVNVIVTDPGHGGYDYGIVTQESKEKDVDLSLARTLNAVFSSEGKTVFMTRGSDRYASIADRINSAEARKPDLFISIHASSSTDRFAIYVSTVKDLNVEPIIKQYSTFSAQNDYFDESKGIAHAIGESLKKEFGNTVVIRRLPLPILYSMDAPAVLIEYPSLDLFGKAQSMQSKFASSVAEGISKYENQ